MKKLFSLSAVICLFISLVSVAATDASRLVEEGNKLWSENKVKEAEAAFREAVEADSEFVAGYSRLAAVLVVQNRSAEAVQAYQSAIMLAPENARLFASLSIAYLHMGHHQMAQAMASHALELDPDMDHAKDISKYIDAKMKVIAEAQASDARVDHGSAGLETIQSSTSGTN